MVEGFHPDPAQATDRHPEAIAHHPDMYPNFLETEFLPKPNSELPFC